jgi:TBC domain-containing protein kinase-like protein
MFQRLLDKYPETREQILREARNGIPSILRGRIWAALLGVPKDTQAIYNSIDKDSPAPIDRQIDLDIPRCHQYHPLLATEEGHAKMRRILKCWVAANAGKLVIGLSSYSFCDFILG